MSNKKYSWQEIEDIIQKYYGLLYKIAYSYTASKEDSEDILQDVFIKFAQQKSFENEEHRKAWLIRVTINKSINLIKSSHRKKSVPLYENINETVEDSDLKSIVMELPIKYRSTIFLYYYEGYSVEEIAEVLGKKTSSIYTLLRRGRDMLKKILEEGGCDNG